MRLFFLALVTMAAGAQIRVGFYEQPAVTIGPYTLWAVQACNGSDGPAEIAGGAVWDTAKTQRLFIPQLTSVVMQEGDFALKTTAKAWLLRCVSWGSAGLTALVASRAVGNLSLDKGAGKAVLAAAPVVSLGLGMTAEAITKVPEKEVDARVDAILPGFIKLAPHDCSAFYVMWGVPVQKELQP